MATAATGRKVSVPAVLLVLSVLACLLLVHCSYGLLELFGPPDLSPEATPLIFALCFLLLLLLAAAAAGNRRALLPRETAGGDVGALGGQALPTTAEEAAVGGEEPHHHQLADDEEMAAAARRAGLLQTEDYPGSGANSRHDPRNPH
ncbi:uncharacterized protein LOC120706549 isoform X1 [Panicum virgatum]|uniref:Uncharacterized protein n=1 Tax=Panicum virgatum TaxID=38727 RepID=A0A8T0SIF0_PANVG|nr:uncharacterized protein LOC120706549 isoform X1 [Panicum virgatum]XP_039847163.1 uncharacterized protein LOC120706549 isoform X1 [Panicum virgatum]KAG2596875.1 hypothetical protein PVAP13_5KG210700 [Panicum virgatum]